MIPSPPHPWCASAQLAENKRLQAQVTAVKTENARLRKGNAVLNGRLKEVEAELGIAVDNE